MEQIKHGGSGEDGLVGDRCEWMRMDGSGGSAVIVDPTKQLSGIINRRTGGDKWEGTSQQNEKTASKS